jgi:hypothetical protein
MVFATRSSRGQETDERPQRFIEEVSFLVLYRTLEPDKNCRRNQMIRRLWRAQFFAAKAR